MHQLNVKLVSEIGSLNEPLKRMARCQPATTPNLVDLHVLTSSVACTIKVLSS